MGAVICPRNARAFREITVRHKIRINYLIMCGIAGLLGASPSDTFASSLHKMTNTLHHRGPDDDGVWVDLDHGIGLSHRRLSVIDLSPAGHQPMQSSSGSYVIAFNGEIYNHLDLREKLAGEIRQSAVRSQLHGGGIRILRVCYTCYM